MAKTRRRRKKLPNIVLLGVDSLLADHMSCYGYHRQTTPHIDRFAEAGALFEKTYSAHIPTTSAYASMLTGLDAFGTQVVALRHKGGLREDVQTLPEILRDHGYGDILRGLYREPVVPGFRQIPRVPQLGQLERGAQPQGAGVEQRGHPGTGTAR